MKTIKKIIAAAALCVVLGTAAAAKAAEYDIAFGEGGEMTVTASENGSALLIKMRYYDGMLCEADIHSLSLEEGENALDGVEVCEGDRLALRDNATGEWQFMTASFKEDIDIAVQHIAWNSDTVNITLTENELTGETKLWQTLIGSQKVELSTQVFYSAPEGMPTYYEKGYFKIRSLAVYKNRLYAACDDGYVLMITECGKCYQLFKPVDFDITEIDIVDGIAELTGEEDEESVDMSQLGGDTVEAADAEQMAANGAVLVDLRDSEDYEAQHYEGSVNIEPSALEERLEEYPKDTVFIFFCYGGTRAAKAVETAKALGYMNVYSLGSVNQLL